MILTTIATILAITGTTNWLLMGLFRFNLVTWIFGNTVFASIIYVLVGIAGLWLLYVIIASNMRREARVQRKN